jgi:methionyl-tRNA formyltransferase
MTLRFVFLVLQEHPYGREMLRILLEREFRPVLVLEEVSPIADEEREKFLTRIAGQPIPPTLAELVGTQIRHQQVDNHNNPTCRQILETLGPDLLVLGGTRIIHPLILEIPNVGTLNAHPGLLPWLRGSSSVAWALYKDLPIGSTVHYVNSGIDAGPIIRQRQLPVHRGETYEQLVRRMLTLSGELMGDTLSLFIEGKVQGVPQDPSVGETLRVIPPELLAQAKARLKEGRYSHYVD